MATYGINPQGVAALRQLHADMGRINTDIEQAGVSLLTQISSLEDGLGTYADQIREIVTEINATQAAGRESVDALRGMVSKLADNVEELLNAGL